MIRKLAWSLCVSAALLAQTVPAWSAVNVERTATENPLGEIVRSIQWGAAGGTLIGLALSLASDENKGDFIKWGFVVGTFGGLGFGIYQVATRPKPTALLEVGGGRIQTGGLAAIDGSPAGLQVRLVGVHF